MFLFFKLKNFSNTKHAFNFFMSKNFKITNIPQRAQRL